MHSQSAYLPDRLAVSPAPRKVVRKTQKMAYLTPLRTPDKRDVQLKFEDLPSSPTSPVPPVDAEAGLGTPIPADVASTAEMRQFEALDFAKASHPMHFERELVDEVLCLEWYKSYLVSVQRTYSLRGASCSRGGQCHPPRGHWLGGHGAEEPRQCARTAAQASRAARCLHLAPPNQRPKEVLLLCFSGLTVFFFFTMSTWATWHERATPYTHASCAYSTTSFTNLVGCMADGVSGRK